MNSAIDIGTRRELFVDEHLIDRMDGVRLDLKHPERREVAFTADAPWEDNVAGFYSLVRDGGTIRLYYRASIPDLKNEDSTLSAVAESTDGGLTFTRPNLGLIEFKGSKQNNILPMGGLPGTPPAFIDTNPACRPDERYKGLASKWQQLFVICSADGLRWRPMLDGPVKMEGTFDTINTAFWDSLSRCYRSYTRFFVQVKEGPQDLLGAKPTAVRAIQSATSQDFIHWTAPVPNVYEDNENLMQLYTNSAQPCPGAEHIYIAFPNRYVQERIARADWPYPGVNDAMFMVSRDGVRWKRYLEAWVRPGPDPRNWSERNNYPTWGIVDTSPTEWSMYISEHYRQPDAPTRLSRLAIRPHGFVSVRADFRGGSFTTKPLAFGGRNLRLNYSTSAIGFIRVEIQDERGKPLPGWTLDDMAPHFGDELDAVMTWKSGSDLSPLIGRPVRFRFELTDADVYALRTTN